MLSSEPADFIEEMKKIPLVLGDSDRTEPAFFLRIHTTFSLAACAAWPWGDTERLASPSFISV